MIEIRWHGRGGQGVVTVSRILAIAAILEGKYAQAIPQFGPERRGAPVLGYTRISDEPIDVHCGVYTCDAVVVIDPTVMGKHVLEGLKEGGPIFINTKRTPGEVREKYGIKNPVYTVDATKIALDIFKKPYFNTPMLGALVRVLKLVKLESLEKALMLRFPEKIAKLNMEAIKRAYEEVKGI